MLVSTKLGDNIHLATYSVLDPELEEFKVVCVLSGTILLEIYLSTVLLSSLCPRLPISFCGKYLKLIIFALPSSGRGLRFRASALRARFKLCICLLVSDKRPTMCMVNHLGVQLLVTIYVKLRNPINVLYTPCSHANY